MKLFTVTEERLIDMQACVYGISRWKRNEKQQTVLRELIGSESTTDDICWFVSNVITNTFAYHTVLDIVKNWYELNSNWVSSDLRDCYNRVMNYKTDYGIGVMVANTLGAFIVQVLRYWNDSRNRVRRYNIYADLLDEIEAIEI